MFDAPDEVMSYLCHQYRVHDVPVGNERTKSMIKTVRLSSKKKASKCKLIKPHIVLLNIKISWESVAFNFGCIYCFCGGKTLTLTPICLVQVIEEPYLKVLYTTEERYTVKRSFYSNKISTSNSVVHPSQYLTITVDAEEKRQLEQQMKVGNSCVKRAGTTAAPQDISVYYIA